MRVKEQETRLNLQEHDDGDDDDDDDDDSTSFSIKTIKISSEVSVGSNVA